MWVVTTSSNSVVRQGLVEGRQRRAREEGAAVDRIIVMDHGKVAVASTHDGLLELDGVYAGLRAAFVGQTEYAA
jgi:DNA polymerase/3'-5' exonuclease PolX